MQPRCVQPHGNTARLHADLVVFILADAGCLSVEVRSGLAGCGVGLSWSLWIILKLQSDIPTEPSLESAPEPAIRAGAFTSGSTCARHLRTHGRRALGKLPSLKPLALDMATLRSAPPMCTRRLAARRLGMRADIEVPGRRTLSRLEGGACIRWSTGARARGCSSGGTHRTPPAQRGPCFYTATHVCNGLLTPTRKSTRAGAAQALPSEQCARSWRPSATPSRDMGSVPWNALDVCMVDDLLTG